MKYIICTKDHVNIQYYLNTMNNKTRNPVLSSQFEKFISKNFEVCVSSYHIISPFLQK